MKKLKKLQIYLAGWSKYKDYRDYCIEKYGDKLDLINPMSITHFEVIDNIGKNQYDTYIVRRDKKLISHSDILVVYLSEKGCTWGSTMEIIYAYENGVPVYVIDDTQGMKNWNDAWVKFHTKKVFSSIPECFNFILSND
jgi:nucleoside 2-deoxyribosyltransferase